MLLFSHLFLCLVMGQPHLQTPYCVQRSYWLGAVCVLWQVWWKTSVCFWWSNSNGKISISLFLGKAHWGSLIWIGQGCAAGSSGPIPMFRGNFFQKKVPMFRDFFPKKVPFFSDFFTFSGVWHSEPRKILKIRSIGISSWKMGPLFRNFFQKTDPKLRHIRVL